MFWPVMGRQIMQRQKDRRRQIYRAKKYPRPDDLDYPDSGVEVSVDEGRYLSFFSEGRKGALAIDWDHAVLNVKNHR